MILASLPLSLPFPRDCFVHHVRGYKGVVPRVQGCVREPHSCCGSTHAVDVTRLGFISPLLAWLGNYAGSIIAIVLLHCCGERFGICRYPAPTIHAVCPRARNRGGRFAPTLVPNESPSRGFGSFFQCAVSALPRHSRERSAERERRKKSDNNNVGITRRNVPTAELGFLPARKRLRRLA